MESVKPLLGRNTRKTCNSEQGGYVLVRAVVMENAHDKQAEAAPPEKAEMNDQRAETYIGERRFPEIFGRG